MHKGMIIAACLVILIVLWGISVYNRLVKSRLSCDEGFAAMDVYMKKRYDLVPNLVETVKGYARHEAETLEKVVLARKQASNAGDVAECEKQMDGAIRQIFAVAEAYPDLKANENFRDLMQTLKTVEEDIASSRRYYNALVREYNLILVKFPSNLIGKLFGFQARTMFAVSDPVERENVKVSF